MRTYYIFKIKEIKDNYNSYNIFKLLNNIYLKKMNREESERVIFKTLDFYDKALISSFIRNLYIDDDFYTFRNLEHSYYDYFSNEKTTLSINDTFIKIVTNKNVPTFLFDLARKSNLFVCDFNNSDFFWLNEISSKLLV